MKALTKKALLPFLGMLLLCTWQVNAIDIWNLSSFTKETQEYFKTTSVTTFNDKKITTYFDTTESKYKMSIEGVVNSIEVTFEAVESFYFKNDAYVICPKGKSQLLHYYKNNSLMKVQSPNYIQLPYYFKCFSYPETNFSDFFFVGFFGKNVILEFDTKILQYLEQKMFEKPNIFGVIPDFNKYLNGETEIYYAIAAFKKIDSSNVDFHWARNVLQFNGDNSVVSVFTNPEEKIFSYSQWENEEIRMSLSKDQNSNYVVRVVVFVPGTNNVIVKITESFLISEKLPKSAINDTLVLGDYDSNYKWLNLEFINDSNLYNYKAEINGKIYSGVADIINKVILFNTDENVDSISAINDKAVNAWDPDYQIIVTVGNEQYTICPMEVGANPCKKCSNWLFLNPNQGNKCVSTEVENSENVNNWIYKCKSGFIPENWSCVTCQSKSWFTIMDSGSCVSSCHEELYVINTEDRTCENCQNNNKYKYWNLNECTTETIQPPSTYITNSEFNVIKPCDSSCSTCNGDLATNCLSCSGERFYEEGTSCVTECSNTKYGGDKDGNQCINCKDKNKYRFLSGKQCVSLDTNDIKNIYVVDADYNIVDYCHETCATCSNGPDDSSDNCDTCKLEGFVLDYNSKKCVNTCDNDKLYKDNALGKCVNCKEKNPEEFKFLNETNPCWSKPEDFKYKLIDESYNIIEKCHANCNSCFGAPNETNQNCETCVPGKYLDYGTSNCVDRCDYKYEQDESEHKCLKCKSGYVKYMDTQSSKYKCILRTEISDIVFNVKGLEDYHIIANCGVSCQSCEKAPITSPNPDDNCATCIFNVTFFDYGTKTCTDSISYWYGISEDRLSLVKCSETSKKYKFYSSTVCIDLPQEGYYVYESTNNILKECYSTCSKCNGDYVSASEQNCTQCKASNIWVGSNCVSSCADSKEGWDESGNCVNCKEKGWVKLENETNCVDSSTLTPYYTVDNDYNVVALCHSSCGSCEQGPNADQSVHNCWTCSSGYYWIYNTTNCQTSCPHPTVSNNMSSDGKCVKCVPEFKEINKNTCISSMPNHFYISDSEFNVIEECSSDCENCVDEKTKCTECFTGKYLSYNGYSCETSCDTDKYEQNGTLKVCRICPDGSYKLKGDSPCLTEGEITFPSYVIDQFYKIIGKCDSSCLECSGPNADNCTKCPTNSYWTYNGNSCLTECGTQFGKNSTTNKCEKCSENSVKKYKINNNSDSECIEEPTSGNNYKVVNQEYGLIELCHTNCWTCSGGPTNDEDNCLTCKSGFYLQPSQSTKCESTCPTHYAKENNNCINCLEKSSQHFKYHDGDTCITPQPLGTFITNSSFNEISDCYSLCESCSAISNDELSQKCTKCRENYFMQFPTTSQNCASNCGSQFGEDSISRECVNCKSQGKFKFKDGKLCISKPLDSFVEDPNYNIIDNCYSSCGTCSSAGNSSQHNCETCRSGYIADSIIHTNCNNICETPKKWYSDENRVFKCVDTCPPQLPITLPPNECVSSCKPNNLYEYNQECINACPASTTPDRDNKCIDDSVPEMNVCTSTITSKPQLTSWTLNNWNIESEIAEEIQMYISSNLDWSASTNVRFTQGDKLSIMIYTNSSCAYDFAIRNNITYSNITQCINNIKSTKEYLSSPSHWIIAEVDITRPEEITNQTVFYIANSQGDKQSLSPCFSITVEKEYPLNIAKIENYEWTRVMFEDGIDIYNSSDPFFNDFCYPYYDDQGKDVILKDRREDFFKNNSLCEEGCDYFKVDFKTARITCECKIAENEETFSKMLENLPMNDFPSSLNLNNLIVVRCYNWVFNVEYLKKSYGFFIMTSWCILQIPCGIIFLIVGLTPWYAYWNQYPENKNGKGGDIESKGNQSDKENNTHTNSKEIEGSCNSSVHGNPPKKKVNTIESSDVSSSSQSESVNSESIEDSRVGGKKGRNVWPILDLEQPKRLTLNKNKKNTSWTQNNNNNNYFITSSSSGFKEYNACIPRSTLVKENKSEFKAKPKCWNQIKTNINTEKVDWNTIQSKEKEGETIVFNDDEWDDLAYEDALKYENRNCCVFFFYILKNKLPLISVFTRITVMEPFMLLLMAFFLTIAIFFVLNAILFDEKYISQRYNTDSGTGILYIIQNELPKCIYASFASMISQLWICYLLNGRKRFEFLIRKEKDPQIFIEKSKEIIRTIKRKYALFLTLNVLMMAFFWYYICAFCAVYQQTQLPWIISSIITLIFCWIFYMFIYFCVTLMRYMGLRCHLSCLYTISTYWV